MRISASGCPFSLGGGGLNLKKQRNNRGSLLVESLVSLSIMSMIIIIMVTSFTQRFQTISHMKREVEGWRYFQDSIHIFKKGETVINRTSDGNLMVWQKFGALQSVTIESANGSEVLSIEMFY